MERTRQRVFDAADGDALFLHRLQQRRLGARAGSVDLVGHQQLAEDRTGDKAEGPATVGFVQNLTAHDVGWHQIGGELDTLGAKAKHHAQGLHQPAFAQSGDPDEQNMATRQ